MNEEYAWLRPKYMPPGFKLLGELKGIPAGEFGEVKGFYGGKFHGAESEEQVAIYYRRQRSRQSHGADIITSWARDPDEPFVGTAHHAGVPVGVNGKQAIYHDGAWAPGPGPDQIKVLADGSAHWSHELEHSLTMRIDRGIVGLRCRRSSVPDAAELIKIMESIDIP